MICQKSKSSENIIYNKSISRDYYFSQKRHFKCNDEAILSELDKLLLAIQNCC